jgi:glycosyltransferase involved in cell wall biosynthesis
VVINARAAVRTEIGGVERFARELAVRLPGLRPDRYRVIRPPIGLAHRAGHLWEQAVLPLVRARLIFGPANLAPAISTRNALVIHDAAALRHPEAYSASYVAYQRRVLPLLVARARLLFTVSEFARAELIELLGASPARVTVVPEGVDRRFSPAADVARVCRRHGLTRPYVLMVGTLSDRKNLTALDRSARMLRERDVELVLAGGDRGYLRASAPRDCRRLGYVSEQDLPGLYAGALAFVMPSRYEGFGLPCLEAMACGVPVVAASAGALPETVGDAALLVSPTDHDGFAVAVLTAIADEVARQGLIRRGLERAARYDWGRTARLADAAIGRALEEP